MFCSKCGSENDDSAKFCTTCGNQLTLDESIKNEKTKSSQGRLNQYKSAKIDNENYVFDRGPIDVIAYLNFKNVTYDSELFKSSSELNYDFSFILPPWEEIYTNDLERYESFEECERINQNLVKTYMENKINLIEVPKFSVKERVNFINEFLI